MSQCVSVGVAIETRIDAIEQLRPVGKNFAVIILSDLCGGSRIDIAGADEFESPFTSKLRVIPRVMSPETANTRSQLLSVSDSLP
jgi:hypothetical protein